MILSSLSIGPGPSVSALFAEQKERLVPFAGREASHRRFTNRPTQRVERSLRVFQIERFPLDRGFQSVTDRLLARLADVRDEGGQDGELRLVAECSHYTWGMPLARRLREIRMLHFGFTYAAALEVVSEDFPGTRPEGWRAKIARRTVASALTEIEKTGRLRIEAKGRLAEELKAQLGQFSQKPVRAADEPAPDEDLVLGLGLLCYALDYAPQPGRVVEADYGDDEPRKPMRPSEVHGWGERR